MDNDKKKPEHPVEPKPECAPPIAEGPTVDMPCADEQDFMAATQAPSDAGETETETETEKLKKENERLKDENAGLKDARLRLLAEFDNYKRRNARDSVRLVETANECLIKELIPVLENFERALDPAHKEKDVEAFYKGVDLIYNLFFNVLKKTGLAEHNPIGCDFDSEKHEAVMQIPCKEHPEHKVAQVIQKGYSLNNKMIKYAKVAVSKGNS